jgi:hypothetical protein
MLFPSEDIPVSMPFVYGDTTGILLSIQAIDGIITGSYCDNFPI